MTASYAEILGFIEAQRAEYRRTLPETIDRIETLWRDARQAHDDRDPLGDLERLGHRLHGTGGTFGFHDLSRAGHALELAVRALIDAGAAPSGELERRVTEAVDALRVSLAPAAPPASPR